MVYGVGYTSHGWDGIGFRASFLSVWRCSHGAGTGSTL